MKKIKKIKIKINGKIKSITQDSNLSILLKIDPKNPVANYRLLIYEGLKSHKKDYKNGQWDAIQSFSRASTYIDTLGEPYFWMGKAYEKKDEMEDRKSVV